MDKYTVRDLYVSGNGSDEVYLASEVSALLRLIACQDEGCGGNLTPEEIYRSMQRLARDALNSTL